MPLNKTHKLSVFAAITVSLVGIVVFICINYMPEIDNYILAHPTICNISIGLAIVLLYLSIWYVCKKKAWPALILSAFAGWFAGVAISFIPAAQQVVLNITSNWTWEYISPVWVWGSLISSFLAVGMAILYKNEHFDNVSLDSVGTGSYAVFLGLVILLPWISVGRMALVLQIVLYIVSVVLTLIPGGIVYALILLPLYKLIAYIKSEVALYKRSKSVKESADNHRSNYVG